MICGTKKTLFGFIWWSVSNIMPSLQVQRKKFKINLGRFDCFTYICIVIHAMIGTFAKVAFSKFLIFNFLYNIFIHKYDTFLHLLDHVEILTYGTLLDVEKTSKKSWNINVENRLYLLGFIFEVFSCLQ